MSAGDSLGTPATGGDDGTVDDLRKAQQVAAQRRLQQTQAQVDDVLGIMSTNVENLLERDQKLSDLDAKAEVLEEGASQFEREAGKLKGKFWLKNLKMMIIMGVIGLVILIIIVMKFMPHKESNPPAVTNNNAPPINNTGNQATGANLQPSGPQQTQENEPGSPTG